MGDISKLTEGRRLSGRKGSEYTASAITYGGISSFPDVQICKLRSWFLFLSDHVEVSQKIFLNT